MSTRRRPGCSIRWASRDRGWPRWVDDELPALVDRGARVVASIWGRRVEDYARAAQLLAGAPGVVAVEVNVSCPNLDDRSRMFAHSAAATAAAVAASAVCGFPLWVKLSPNVADLTDIAGAAVDAGAEALVLVNTLLGMAIDPVTAHLPAGLGPGRWRPVRSGHPAGGRPGRARLSGPPFLWSGSSVSAVSPVASTPWRC